MLNLYIGLIDDTVTKYLHTYMIFETDFIGHHQFDELKR